MDYDSNNENAHDEEYPLKIESNFPFSPNSKDYGGSTEEGKDEEYPPSQYLRSTDDHSEDNIPHNDDENSYTYDDPVMEMLPRNIVSRSRRRPIHINPRCSHYTRGREKYMTRIISISSLISSECCKKYCLKHMDFKFALEKRKRYLSMNKSMQISYLVGCMQYTLSGYDYHIGSLFICRKAFKMFHSMGNFCLSRIQENLEKDPTFYLEVCHKRQFGPLSNTTMLWMKGFFSKHGECIPNREIIHIPNNFSRLEIYNLYKEYAEGAKGHGRFIIYQYFVKIWKKEFNNVHIPKKTRIAICNTCAYLK